MQFTIKSSAAISFSTSRMIRKLHAQHMMPLTQCSYPEASGIRPGKGPLRICQAPAWKCGGINTHKVILDHQGMGTNGTHFPLSFRGLTCLRTFSKHFPLAPWK